MLYIGSASTNSTVFAHINITPLAPLAGCFERSVPWIEWTAYSPFHLATETDAKRAVESNFAGEKTRA